MILDEIDELVNFINLNAETQCSFGDKDLAVDQLPHIKIIPVSNIGIISISNDDNDVTFPVTIKIIVSRENERDGLAIAERLLSSLPGFDKSQGHFITESASAEYTKNTYEITIGYNLKSIIGV